MLDSEIPIMDMLIRLIAAAGLACGIGNFALAGMVTILALIIMVVLGRFEHEVINKK